MTRVECWGSRSGIVKVIPPKEWTTSLPPLNPQLRQVKIRTPIEQHMLGRGGLFRQENMEKRKVMSVREWAELCAKDEFRALGVNEVGLHARSANYKPKAKKSKKKSDAANAESLGPDIITIKQESTDDVQPIFFGDAGSIHRPIVLSPPSSVATPVSPTVGSDKVDAVLAESETKSEEKSIGKGRRVAQTRMARETSLADRVARDMEFLDTFDPHTDWLPATTKPTDYTPEFCQKLERQYWRNCGLGRPAWYGADTQGSLYTDETTSWNVAHLPSTLSRLLPSSDQGLPGVNTPYLYFGMWRATFAWHVEDMDLFSINYIHFGAPKFWYSVPQGRANALEQTMRGYFPKDTSTCPQFLRHKSFLASPTLLAQSSCRPNHLVQHAGEFVVTFPRGYHAGFNLGFNCAESVNFALDSWLDLGRVAKACKCISDSVRIDVDQLLRDRAIEASNQPESSKSKCLPSKTENITIKIKKENNDSISILNSPHKRKSEGGGDTPALKKIKIKAKGASQTESSSRHLPKLSVTLKLGPRPTEPESYPCCLCISTNREGLLRVHDPPVTRKDAVDAAGNPKEWMAHEYCANVVPETWVDEIEFGQSDEKEKVVFGVDGIVKDRWHLKCSACSKSRPKAHGAPIQCTKGKCPKAFHVSCARDSEGDIVFNVLKEVEKEVVLLDPTMGTAPITSTDQMQVDSSMQPVDPMETEVPLSSPPTSRVIKVIRKLEIQVLCVQHNPAIAAAKRANKQDKIKNDLLALPSMARIKIRVSAGVFEVSLVRVIEETSSVEVLWDRGIKRDFKWGSVVFGSTDGPVQQKPSEPAPDSQPPRSVVPISSGLPVPTYSSVTAATATHLYQSSQPYSNAVVPTTMQSFGNQVQYPHPSGLYDNWPYRAPFTSAQPPHHSYGYGYYPSGASGAAATGHYNGYAYSQHPPTQLQWQQSYQNQGYYRHGQPQQPTQPPGIDTDDPSFKGASSLLSPPIPAPPAAQSSTQTQPPPMSGSVETEPAPNNLGILAALQPAQIEEMLRNNPQLRDVVIAAINDAKKVLPSSS